MTRIYTYILLLILVPSATLIGQATAWLVVDSNYPQAIVLVDSVDRGAVDHSPISVQPGRHAVTLLPPVADSWLFSRPAGEFEAAAGDTVSLKLNFDYVYQFATDPFGADVYLLSEDGDFLLGKTPLLLRRERPIEVDLLFKLQGYESARQRPNGEILNRMDIVLQPDERIALEEGRHLWAPPQPRRRWINYSAALVAITSGVFAAHYKMRADELFDEYSVSGNPDLRPEIRRYDTYSAVALGTMQVGVGVLAIRLILR